jgi:DNA polymerase elongation subunit (family B)
MCKGFNNYFPELNEEEDTFIRKAYRGGFTYVNPKNQGKTIKGNCICMDVNSLYPSRLCLCPMPYQKPVYFEGQYKQDSVYPLYVQRLICTFRIKKDKIPSIQIKNTSRFVANEYLTDSGSEPVELTLTNVDLNLMFQQYDVEVLEYIGGYKFKSCIGLFNQYIDYWMKEKTKAKKEKNSARFSISKLFMNSLYGKFATSKNGQQKIPVFDSEGVLHYVTGEVEEMKSVYLPTAVFTTAEGRYLTITTSQKIRDWTEQNLGFDGYLYSDTDSCYVKIELDQLEKMKETANIDIDPYRLGAWDIEQDNITRFKALRQKCYIKEFDGEIHATVAGCPKELSRLFNFKNFNVGFTTANFTPEQIGKDAKLRYMQVKGGVILKETDFTIK